MGKKRNNEGNCWKITENLRDKDKPKLTNLGGKRMNSTKLHSLLRDASRRNGSWRLCLQRWRARKRIKEGGKTRRGPPQGRRGRWREQRGTHADSSEFQRAGKTSEDSGLGDRERKVKRKLETATGPENCG